MSKPGGEIRIIAGKWRGRLLPVCDHEGLRPTPNRVRETLFNWLQPNIVGARCLDLFAGTGALGFEALSRGAEKVTFVESRLPIMQQLKSSAEKLDALSSCEFRQQDATHFLRSSQLMLQSASSSPNMQLFQPYDIIFMDPPFGSALLDQCLVLLEKSAFMGDHTRIYVESAIPLVETGLPQGWQLIKQQKAGAVFYHLIMGA